MTTEQRKEELRKTFKTNPDYVFEYLYSELQRLEEIIKAADEVMNKASWSQGDSYYEAKEHYNNLKKKQDERL